LLIKLNSVPLPLNKNKMDKKPTFYTNYCEFKNEVDIVNKLLSIYSIVKKNGNLRDFEKKVLNYYIRKGYSTKTKKQIVKELGLKQRNLNQTNYHLTNKGYLKQSTRNQKNKSLNKELQDIRKYFVEGNMKAYVIGFKQK